MLDDRGQLAGRNAIDITLLRFREASVFLFAKVSLRKFPESVRNEVFAPERCDRIANRIPSEPLANSVHRSVCRPSGDPSPRTGTMLLIGET